MTRYDPRYTFAEYAGRNVGDRVVVCVLEQNLASTQKIPAITAEQAALSTYGELEDLRPLPGMRPPLPTEPPENGPTLGITLGGIGSSG